jgi:hypothetical protein
LSLGFLDLKVKRVFTHIRCAARRGALAQARGRLELGFGREHMRKRSVVARTREGSGGRRESDWRKEKGEWGQPRLEPPYL